MPGLANRVQATCIVQMKRERERETDEQKESERERERQRETETERQRQRQRERQRQRQRERETNRKRERHTHREKERETDKTVRKDTERVKQRLYKLLLNDSFASSLLKKERFLNLGPKLIFGPSNPATNPSKALLTYLSNCSSYVLGAFPAEVSSADKKHLGPIGTTKHRYRFGQTWRRHGRVTNNRNAFLLRNDSPTIEERAVIYTYVRKLRRLYSTKR